jgi:hypothetical protein
MLLHNEGMGEDIGEGGMHVVRPHAVEHYYGDHVRQLFIVAAALMLLGAPFYATNLRAELPFEIIGALALVALAGIATPHSKTVWIASSIVAGVALVIYESWALFAYEESTWLQFILRELIALLLFAAFYFSVKTLRAFMLRQVGRADAVDDFERDAR